jgi:single-strand DNA-binding protein
METQKMYVRLIGFLGKDAEVKTTKSGNEYAILSLATQASWKDKKSGDYVNRTEWHRMIVMWNLRLRQVGNLWSLLNLDGPTGPC